LSFFVTRENPVLLSCPFRVPKFLNSVIAFSAPLVQAKHRTWIDIGVMISVLEQAAKLRVWLIFGLVNVLHGKLPSVGKGSNSSVGQDHSRVLALDQNHPVSFVRTPAKFLQRSLGQLHPDHRVETAHRLGAKLLVAVMSVDLALPMLAAKPKSL
jgi:hypothetical protein